MNTQLHFNGPDYVPAHDQLRLLKQHDRVKTVLLRGSWMTLEEIAGITDDPQASISAHIRHLRKERFGGYIVEKRRRGPPSDGLFEYQITGQRVEG